MVCASSWVIICDVDVDIIWGGREEKRKKKRCLKTGTTRN